MNYWQGAKIRLRGIEPSDAETFFRWNLDSDTGRYLDFVWPPISRALVQKQADEGALKTMEADSFTWIMEDSEGVAVGSIMTHHCSPRNGTFAYGINVLAEHQRKGYASEAIRFVVTYYFEELRYQKVTAEVYSHNAASRALHERLGFQLEGTIRRMIYSGGEYHDILYYGMTDNEWKEQRLVARAKEAGR